MHYSRTLSEIQDINTALNYSAAAPVKAILINKDGKLLFQFLFQVSAMYSTLNYPCVTYILKNWPAPSGGKKRIEKI